MKYRVVKVEQATVDTVYEVERDFKQGMMVVPIWEFISSFDSLKEAEQYIQSKSQPTRTVIKEYEV